MSARKLAYILIGVHSVVLVISVGIVLVLVYI